MSGNHPSPTEPNFDRVARLYRWAEYLALGPILQQTRTALVNHLGGSREAVLFGDGDGRFLTQLLSRYPYLQATAVDTSATMLRLLQARCERASSTAAARLTTRHGSALDALIPPTTDLLVTHFFLDCLPQQEVNRLVGRVAASVQPGTLWLVSDFEVPNKPFLRHAAGLYIHSLYFAFRLLTGLQVRRLPDPQAALAASGFRRLLRHRKLGGLLYSELWVLDPAPTGERHNPGASRLIHNPMDQHPENSADIVSPADSASLPADPQPNPEPAAPSLAEPDPGVFHHEPGPVPHTSSSDPAPSQKVPERQV